MFTLSVLLWILEVGELVGDVEADRLRKPVVTVDPAFRKFITGEKITLSCRCDCPATRIEYFHNGQDVDHKDFKKIQCKTYLDHSFSVGRAGKYICRCQTWKKNGWIHSDESDPVQIHIGDKVSPPTISKRRSNSDTVLISCEGDIRFAGGIFYLHRIPSEQHVQTLEVSDGQKKLTFAINVTDLDSLGNYSCRYQTFVLGHWKLSPFSKSVEVTEKENPELGLQMRPMKSSVCKMNKPVAKDIKYDGLEMRLFEQNNMSLAIGPVCAAFIIVLLIAALIAGVIIKRRE
ncbi:uncharacterized protein [Scyliorhinus torazame]|uniref:uncharacterized protein n=1 Tax=Scyliorhinus torazame TaxID=75743 RepID=UPI003B5CC571